MKDSQNVKKKQETIKKEKSKHFRKKAVSAVIFEEKKKEPLLKKYENDLSLLFIPSILFIVLLILSLVNEHFLQEISHNQILPLDTRTTLHPYPLVDGSIPFLNLSAKTAIVIDADSQVVVFSKNPELRFSMASTTKIMTALTALDYYQPESLLTVDARSVEGSMLGLQQGDTFYFIDLLYAMLLPSANDAAATIAANYPGGVEAFVAKMNEKAAALQLSNTHFADPTGLEDDGDYTTVVDMAHLASFAIENKQFTEVTGTKHKMITNVAKTNQYALSNLNKLLGVDGVTGIKTGTTEGAGEVLVTSTVANGHTYIIVVMNSQDRFADTEMLLTFIAQNVRYIRPTLSNHF